MPTSLVLSCQSQMLENSQSPPVGACVCGKWGGGDHLCACKCEAVTQRGRASWTGSTVSFSNCGVGRKGRNMTLNMTRRDCTSCWKQRLNSSLKVRISVTLWLHRFGRVLGPGSLGVDWFSRRRETFLGGGKRGELQTYTWWIYLFITNKNKRTNGAHLEKVGISFLITIKKCVRKQPRDQKIIKQSKIDLILRTSIQHT